MDRCPPETWAEICAFACTDDGRTGRSLSLVSRFINEVSKQYKLQSVAVVGIKQLLPFASLLERLPPSLRRVTSIFLTHRASYDTFKPYDRLHHIAWGEASKVLKRVLRMIAPYVRVVHWAFVLVTSEPLILVEATRFPMLQEFVLDGIGFWTTDAPHWQPKHFNFPTLTHLDVTSFYCYPVHVMEIISKWMPCLTHLRITTQLELTPFDEMWAMFSTQISNNELTLPAQLKRIYIRVPPEPQPSSEMHQYYGRFLGYLEPLAKVDARITLLSPHERGEFPIHTALTRWMDISDGSQRW